jgi:uncharacterized protein YndB with AHSA1/START domain
MGVDEALAEQARRLGVNVSAAAREGVAVRSALAQADRAAYLREPEEIDDFWTEAERWLVTSTVRPPRLCWTARMAAQIEIVRDIAAPPEAVYAAISDVTRMGEWSEECVRCEWTGGSDSPVVGATFDGHNRNGDNEWTSQCTITEADPGRSFVFQCAMYDFHYSTWGYRIEPTAEGSRVTEWAEDLRPEEAMELSKQISGIEDRGARNEQTISGTLEKLAAALEA